MLDTLSLAQSCPRLTVVVAVSGARRFLPAAVDKLELWEQGEGDLGERMERCLRRGLETHTRSLVIGTDSPGLPRELLNRR